MNRLSLPTAYRLLPASLAVAFLCVGCATLGQQGQPLVPTRYETRTGPYVVYTSFPIASDAPAIRHLQSLDHHLEATLGMRVEPGDHPIEVYVLNDRHAFTHFLTFYYPELPPRRAFFLAQGGRRVIYTFLGERLEEDLRHEATHALLHVALDEIPLWLDEGLAEYFEGPDDREGSNAEHLKRLPQDRSEGWTPNLARLEALKDVRQMSPRDYRESWAWVHYLLNGTPEGKAILLAYLSDLRAATPRKPLSERLNDEDLASGRRLLAHLDRIRERPVAVVTPSPDGTVRLQNAPSDPFKDPLKTNPQRRTFFGRIRDLLGI